MRQAFWSALFVVLPVLSYGQESKQAAPPKQNGGPPAVMSPKATIPSAPVADGTKPAPETDPAKMALDRNTKPQSLAPVSEKTYVIGAEDILQIVVWGDKTLSASYIVRPDGRFGIPLAGEFMAAGKTPEELAAEIADRLKTGDILRNPNVTVGLQEVRSKVIYIMGEVNRPGKYPLVVPTNVMQALTNAGGFKEFANQKNIIIQRDKERFKFNYKEVTQGKKTEQNILLQAGDYIIVK